MHSASPVGRRDALALTAAALTRASSGQWSAGRFHQVGTASWYGAFHHGRRMSNGRPFDMRGNSAAHRHLPLGTRARVTSLRTGLSEVVWIEDRGPYVAGRVIDLSMGTAKRLGMLQAGVGPVEIVVEPGDVARGRA